MLEDGKITSEMMLCLKAIHRTSYWSLILQPFDKALQDLQPLRVPQQGSLPALRNKLAEVQRFAVEHDQEVDLSSQLSQTKPLHWAKWESLWVRFLAPLLSFATREGCLEEMDRKATQIILQNTRNCSFLTRVCRRWVLTG